MDSYLENQVNGTQPEEIVFTYRGAEPEPVVLRYERSLPQRMRPEEPASGGKENKAPPDKGRRWRWIGGVALFAALLCVGVGLRFLQLTVWTQSPPGYQEPSGAGEIPWEDYYDSSRYYWEQRQDNKETTIDTFRPYGGSVVTLRLEGVEEDAPVLTPGEIYKKLLPSVPAVLGLRENGEGSVGTGIIFDESGYVLTNYHIIAGCSSCSVRVMDENGVERPLDALLVGGDEEQDLAVLKIEGENLTAASFGISDRLSVGDKVYAIGNPLELRNTFTDGIISAINRDMDVDGVAMTLLQTNAALNSGNSGGPLINQYGQVVGINTIKMMSGYDTIEGLGFAIPTSVANRWVNELIQYGKILPQPALGVTILKTPEILPDGSVALRIQTVTPDSSAGKIGLEEGDCLVSFNGQEVKSVEEVLAIRRTLSVGDNVPLRIWRDGAYLDLIMVMYAE